LERAGKDFGKDGTDSRFQTFDLGLKREDAFYFGRRHFQEVVCIHRGHCGKAPAKNQAAISGGGFRGFGGNDMRRELDSFAARRWKRRHRRSDRFHSRQLAKVLSYAFLFEELGVNASSWSFQQARALEAESQRDSIPQPRVARNEPPWAG
jgi:hypothetical protein